MEIVGESVRPDKYFKPKLITERLNRKLVPDYGLEYFRFFLFFFNNHRIIKSNCNYRLPNLKKIFLQIKNQLTYYELNRPNNWPLNNRPSILKNVESTIKKS